jgi:hypothetical protein
LITSIFEPLYFEKMSSIFVNSSLLTFTACNIFGWAAKSLQPKIPPQEKISHKIPPQENPSQQNASTGKYLPTKYL